MDEVEALNMFILEINEEIFLELEPAEVFARCAKLNQRKCEELLPLAC